MARNMTALVAVAANSVEDPSAFAETTMPVPAPRPHDLLVEVRAVSVNPVDTKVRAGLRDSDPPRVLGFDAAGTVVGIGDEVSRFAVGDEVYYAGSIGRPGTNAEFHLVDERIVGRKPSSLDFGAAAALPLTTITAWESLFEKLRVDSADSGTIVVVAGAGGVGSMVIQLARSLTDLTVIATASRPESQEWARGLGAHHVVDPRRLREDVRSCAPGGVDYIFSPHSDGNVESYADIMGVHGQVVAIDEPEGLDTLPLKQRSQSWHWELMFSKPLFAPEDDSQHRILGRVAELVDAGKIRSTVNRELLGFTIDNLRTAHQVSESGGAIGKVVLTR
ncbi:zinc-binding alcohol dehydrogenase family protein [Gordonia hongkongensis]|uniref:Zinc-type alcohol dehydrogenase-like protein n=1 Tax=Gordonia hongkongensis TaxID=1701090 RepID=A0AAX3T608_9ACTN|nr:MULTISPECIES: zinc-binding alcohol dehydrogenase family protein [Gordonia]MCX2753868.1 zinc-binding alcohol dehydrogenase family protein [Gordonia sp. 4N]WFP24341.1 zinc-binding alcohol dehydrogenase family protein [Gordonia hongkongensis]